MNKNDKSTEIIAQIERFSRLMHASEHETSLNPVQWETLRYLARCNRFSNSPKALTSYLMSTKGTVSQTLIALERKGLVIKRKRDGQNRSIELILTDEGLGQLELDPWKNLADHISLLSAKDLNNLNQQLHNILLGALADRNFQSFSLCKTCRHFGKNENKQSHDFPHQCNLINVPLANSDSERICVEYESAG